MGGHGRLTADDASHLPAAAAAAVTSAKSATYAATKQTASATKTHRQLPLMHKPNKHRQLLLQRGLVHPSLRGWGSSRCCGYCFRCYCNCCSGLQRPERKIIPNFKLRPAQLLCVAAAAFFHPVSVNSSRAAAEHNEQPAPNGSSHGSSPSC